MVVEEGFCDAWVPEQGQVLDRSLMRSPPSDFFYRLVAVNESGRSRPSGVLPLLLPRVGEGAKSAPKVYYFVEEGSQHVMQVGQRKVLSPFFGGEAEKERDGEEEAGGGGEDGWLTRDLTQSIGLPRAAAGGRVCVFGPEEEGRVVYGGWDGHLVKADIIGRKAAEYPLCIHGSPTVWRWPTKKADPEAPAPARAWVRNASMNSLFMLSFDPVSEQHSIVDVSLEGPQLEMLGGSPVAVSESEVCFVGQDQNLYRVVFSFEDSYKRGREGGRKAGMPFKYTVINHTALSQVRVRSGEELLMLDRQKVVYVSAEEGGHLMEESRAGAASDEAWLVTNHTALHGAAPPLGGTVQVVPQGVAKVLFQGAADLQWYELWWAGESWRVSREIESGER